MYIVVRHFVAAVNCGFRSKAASVTPITANAFESRLACEQALEVGEGMGGGVGISGEKEQALGVGEGGDPLPLPRELARKLKAIQGITLHCHFAFTVELTRYNEPLSVY